jgi:misacylated tRNA(Ala) deacylase
MVEAERKSPLKIPPEPPAESSLDGAWVDLDGFVPRYHGRGVHRVAGRVPQVLGKKGGTTGVVRSRPFVDESAFCSVVVAELHPVATPRSRKMTELLYQTDSYLREFTATVTDVNADGSAVALDRTAFYPGGGGQPCDFGTLTANGQTWTVTRVKKRGADVWHTMQGALPEQGTSVSGRIDWGRRYGLMRIHTALHILCGVIWRDYGASVTGGNMELGRARMDFEFERMQKELVNEIEAKINAEVEAARAIKVDILPREEAFQIPDLIRTKINLLPWTCRPMAARTYATRPKWDRSRSWTIRAKGASTSAW